jgi:hypothetical protein
MMNTIGLLLTMMLCRRSLINIALKKNSLIEMLNKSKKREKSIRLIVRRLDTLRPIKLVSTKSSSN